jgi:hypothetical protein
MTGIEPFKRIDLTVTLPDDTVMSCTFQVHSPGGSQTVLDAAQAMVAGLRMNGYPTRLSLIRERAEDLS